MYGFYAAQNVRLTRRRCCSSALCQISLKSDWDDIHPAIIHKINLIINWNVNPEVTDIHISYIDDQIILTEF